MRTIVMRSGGRCILDRLVPVLLGSLWLLGWGIPMAEPAVFWGPRPPIGDQPPARREHALAYDTARGRVVLFGGKDGSGSPLPDTWEWDGAAGTWQNVTPASGDQPPARRFHALAYDTARGRVVLFGGKDGSGSPLQDTWEWDGSGWSPVTLASGSPPPARHGHAVAYDRARGQVVLFGGQDGSGQPLQDTWVWDGGTRTWTNVSPATGPPARYWHALAYDAARRRVVLFGGFDGSAIRGDTWVWDGTTWTDVSPAGSPGLRCEHALVYHPARERVVLFGGWDGSTAHDETWEWDGAAWALAPLTGSPPSARLDHALAYDAARGEVVLFSGGPAPSNSPGLPDTWVYDDDNPVRQGYWTINECREQPIGSKEPCYWHYRYDRTRCPPGQPCSKLVVFFSTGLQVCDEPATFTADTRKGKILQAYAVNDNYVAVCANTFLTGEGPGSVSFNGERDRVDQLMRNIADQTSASPTLQATFMRSLWNGRHLLWSGVSHGATAPVVAMARTTFDSDLQRPWWRGSAVTAACFYDGVYDMFNADDFWGRNSCPGLHTRLIGRRYYGQDVFVHFCGNGKCACAPEHSPEIDEDSLVDTPGDGLTPPSPAAAEDFAIPDWKLIECGSALPDKCQDDVLPMETIQALCDRLGPSRCTFASLPNHSHNNCADSAIGIPMCRIWFNAKVGP